MKEQGGGGEGRDQNGPGDSRKQSARQKRNMRSESSNKNVVVPGERRHRRGGRNAEFDNRRPRWEARVAQGGR